MPETNEKKRPAASAFAALMMGSKKNGGGTKSAKQQKIEAAVEIGNKDIEAVLQQLGALPATAFTCSIISKGRPKNVQANLALFKGTGVVPTFIIGKGETEAYKKNGATKCIEGGGLCASRNAAIELVSLAPQIPLAHVTFFSTPVSHNRLFFQAKEEGNICLEMSDDLSQCKVLHQDIAWERPGDLSEANALAKATPQHLVSPVNAARYIEVQMREKGAKLGGVYCTQNEGQAMNSQAVSEEAFILGDLMVIDPESTPRFDEKMSLKEDYDLTAQHLHLYGNVLRSNRVVIQAQHYTNAGGAVADRTAVKEQYNIAVMRHKWPGVFPQHTTRGENEVNMRWGSRSKLLGGKKDVPRPDAPEGWEDLRAVLKDMPDMADEENAKPEGVVEEKAASEVAAEVEAAPVVQEEE